MIPALYLGGIAAAELVPTLVNPIGGIVFHISFASEPSAPKLFLFLSLAPLIRVLSLSMPLAGFPQLY